MAWRRPWTRRLLLLAAVLLLAGCAGHRPRSQAPLPPLRLSPAGLPTPLALQQQLNFRFGPVQRELEALLEADATQVQLVVQAMGQTGLRVRWDGRQLQEQRAAWLPRQVRAGRVLDDLQFALWPTGAIAAALPPGWQVSDDGRLRCLRHAGQDALCLRRDADGALELDNLAEGYSLRIRSVEPEASLP